jgi:hypothetical protein
MALASDDAALRELFRQTPLPGTFEVTLEHEPCYFHSVADAARHDVFVGTRDGRVIGCGSRVTRESWWEGKESLTAYLGDLRCHPSMQRRAGWLIRDGYRALAGVAAESPTSVTWTAVFEENTTARKVLAGRPAKSKMLPAYLDRGRLFCPILPVPRRAKPPRLSGVTWHQGKAGDWEEVAGFLNAQSSHRPLAPSHRASDFAGRLRWPCLDATDFLLARRGDRLVGSVAVWDLRPVRQVRLAALHGWLKQCRLPVNGLARLLGWPGLPRNGSILPMAFVSFLAVENEEPELAGAMLLAARALAARRGLGFLCACAHEDHPFAKVLGRLTAIPSHGRLYQVVLNGSHNEWPAIAPHIEPALL